MVLSVSTELLSSPSDSAKLPYVLSGQFLQPLEGRMTHHRSSLWSTSGFSSAQLWFSPLLCFCFFYKPFMSRNQWEEKKKYLTVFSVPGLLNQKSWKDAFLSNQLRGKLLSWDTETSIHEALIGKLFFPFSFLFPLFGIFCWDGIWKCLFLQDCWILSDCH